MTTTIHPSALVDPAAELGEGVTVGPWAIIGPDVTVGDGSVIAARATLERNVKLGREVTVGIGSILGGAPQDTKYRGEETWVEIGDRTHIREYSTVNRGTTDKYRTVIGADSFLMTYVHVAHDCVLGDSVTIANGTQMAGHVTIEDHAIVSGLVVLHQFVTVGAYAFVGGGTRVNMDIPPFCKAVNKLYGLNAIGLQRAGFTADTVSALKRAYRIVFNSHLSLSRALEKAREEVEPLPEVEQFLDFVRNSNRGVTV